MKILIATPFLPWPLCDGGRVAQYRTIESLREDCHFTIVVPLTSSSQEAEVEEFSKKFSHVTVKPVRCYEKARRLSHSAKFRRTVGQILRWVFPAPKDSYHLNGEQSRPDFSEKLPHYPFSILDQRFLNAVASEMKMGYDVFQAEFVDMLTLGILAPIHIPKLFIHHQLHFMYAQRLVAENIDPSPGARYLVDRIAVEEVAFLDKFDSVVVFSENDACHLRALCPKQRVEVSPFPTPENPVEKLPTHVGDAKSFVLLASEYHPNIDGLNWFMKKVWPEIKRQRVGFKIQVVGRWGQQAISSIEDSAEIEFLGFVQDINDCMLNSVMIVPLWVGSGIRSKIMVAWGAGCPVVSTSIGIEGINAVSRGNSMVADTPESFAQACLELGINAELRNAIALRGWKDVKAEYSIEAVRSKRLSIYNSLLNSK